MIATCNGEERAKFFGSNGSISFQAWNFLHLGALLNYMRFPASIEPVLWPYFL